MEVSGTVEVGSGAVDWPLGRAWQRERSWIYEKSPLHSSTDRLVPGSPLVLTDALASDLPARSAFIGTKVIGYDEGPVA